MTAPVGTIAAFGGATLPDGWLVCDGAAVSRTTYANLYSVLGDAFGAGDGTTTFNLPDLRTQRVVIGAGAVTATLRGAVQPGSHSHPSASATWPNHGTGSSLGHSPSAGTANSGPITRSTRADGHTHPHPAANPSHSHAIAPASEHLEANLGFTMMVKT